MYPLIRKNVLGALEPLIQNVSHPANISLLRNCTWSLSNFCRGKPAPCLDIIKKALPVLTTIIASSNDQVNLPYFITSSKDIYHDT